MTTFSSFEIDQLAVVVPNLDNSDGVVLGGAQVVDLSHDRHQAIGSPSAIDVASL
jgi:hypothetical protein